MLQRSCHSIAPVINARQNTNKSQLQLRVPCCGMSSASLVHSIIFLPERSCISI